ncbi:3-ketoacyl-CoA thiolase [Desulfosporosinus acididurans]|uniref:Acetoacetyl-CoA thiolase n=1 Tax=Desulfosporosinus acididurans TaxID=476652 RepID=A0A0J1FN97_9FIRM|nr:thiolase family protein [Desulfosporosinus acididurans]KLU64817.1 3-ketoacyl-CoA thiolase [Desulfosporosinus acididurans]
MKFTKAYIPYGGYFSSPFVRWNGSLKGDNSVILGASTARRWFVEKQIDPNGLDFLYYGITTAQPLSFYGHAYSAAVILDRQGKDIPALQINQVCATSCTTLGLAAKDIETDSHGEIFALSVDRTSSTPLLVCPDPLTGAVSTENIVLDNFERDPSPGAGLAMFQTAEAVAKEAGITREECDEIAVLRYEQYLDALANDRAFQKRYMFPLEAHLNKKKIQIIAEDEGVTPSTKEGMAKLKPVTPNGVLTFGSQTHPADGNCGTIVTTKERAQEISKDPNITVQILSYAITRVGAGRMAAAPVPALELALKDAGLKAADLSQIKTHNPFVVNDVNLSKKLGVNQKIVNNYGSSMIYGHPQGPTAGRAVIELIEALAVQGGGYGAFTGCAAGDIGASLVVKVN